MEAFCASLAFLWGIHRSPVNYPHKGQWCGALMFSWINAWVNNREVGDLRRHRGHYDVIVMLVLLHSRPIYITQEFLWQSPWASNEWDGITLLWLVQLQCIDRWEFPPFFKCHLQSPCATQTPLTLELGNNLSRVMCWYGLSQWETPLQWYVVSHCTAEPIPRMTPEK